MYGQKTNTLNISSKPSDFHLHPEKFTQLSRVFHKKTTLPLFGNVLLRKAGNYLTLYIVLYLFKQ